MFIVCMETREVIIVKEDHPLNEFRLGFLIKQLQSSFSSEWWFSKVFKSLYN